VATFEVTYTATFAPDARAQLRSAQNGGYGYSTAPIVDGRATFTVRYPEAGTYVEEAMFPTSASEVCASATLTVRP
jgi:hypothetical protein